MRPRGWASFWTILAAIAGVVGAAQPSIRCSTHIHNSFRRDFCRADDAISMPLDDPERSSSPQRSSRCNGQQSLSCRHPATFVSRREATYRFVPSKRWPLSSNSRMLALSPSVEPAFTGHCGGDGERCDARPEGSGDVAIATAPVAGLSSTVSNQKGQRHRAPESLRSAQSCQADRVVRFAPNDFIAASVVRS